jgi:hypothetical protein
MEDSFSKRELIVIRAISLFVSCVVSVVIAVMIVTALENQEDQKTCKPAMLYYNDACYDYQVCD